MECHKLPLYPYQNNRRDNVLIMWIIAFEHSTTGHTMTDQKDIAELADRVAEGIGVTDDLGVQAIAGFIEEYKDKLDLSDFNATFQFILELWEIHDL